jgi:L-asparaginase type I
MRVQVLNTGGTVSSTPAATGATTTFDPGGLLTDNTSVSYEEVFRKWSVNLEPSDWQVLARAVHEAIAAGADGIVVLHGTDTMSYTAAALSFMLPDPSVPVVLTGSMRPGGAPDSDAASNLRDAVTVAASDLAEVCVCFSGDPAGATGVVLRGNRARKAHTARLDAFESPAYPALGVVDGPLVRLDQGTHRPATPGAPPRLELDVEPNVSLIHYHPGCSARFVAAALAEADGAVIIGTGAGRLPTEGGVLDAIRDSGKPCVLVSATWAPGGELGGYDLDRELLAVENLVDGLDLTPEAALAKLMWVLATNRSIDDVRAAIQQPLAGELTAKESP